MFCFASSVIIISLTQRKQQKFYSLKTDRGNLKMYVKSRQSWWPWDCNFSLRNNVCLKWSINISVKEEKSTSCRLLNSSQLRLQQDVRENGNTRLLSTKLIAGTQFFLWSLFQKIHLLLLSPCRSNFVRCAISEKSWSRDNKNFTSASSYLDLPLMSRCKDNLAIFQKSFFTPPWHFPENNFPTWTFSTCLTNDNCTAYRQNSSFSGEHSKKKTLEPRSFWRCRPPTDPGKFAFMQVVSWCTHCTQTHIWDCPQKRDNQASRNPSLSSSSLSFTWEGVLTMETFCTSNWRFSEEKWTSPEIMNLQQGNSILETHLANVSFWHFSALKTFVSDCFASTWVQMTCDRLTLDSELCFVSACVLTKTLITKQN